ncbi:hypothetical protein SpiGrapes_0966 [Sphaerochaeta pleomorpha str. Grapes]|uniref:Uncharacterized protein n=1 Tax=Sphaerochaeta pleomorpha (strain ATCC BAA-1885 / DSM 22778 / Grapes) TaxID=158190 RepID=G8QRD8_SPHPG|nr:hypothetical protein [Sphaerochaeta pleomorpha]AEV28791.1 hypothetical protein SpiGrapes_0966 [Sphaerochaeta pleomorpha str. Grapes]
MKKKVFLLLVLVSFSLSSLFAFQVEVPNEVPAFRNLELTLEPGPNDGTVDQARFYFQMEGKREYLYVEFTQDKGNWTALVPFTYLTGEELVYYTQVKTTEGTFIRDPQIGTKKARLLQDTTAPTLKLVSPQAFELALDKKQLVVFEIIDESALTSFEIFLEGEPLMEAGVFQQYLSFLIQPAKAEDAVISISMIDKYGNAKQEEYIFAITGEKAPFFVADGKLLGEMQAEYILSMGEGTNTTKINEVVSDTEQQVNLSFEVGGEAYLKAGPIALELKAILKDSLSVFDILEAYPNTLTADLQNFINLWHPWNFAEEFDYTGEVARGYENDNTFSAQLSFFGPVLTYTLGDQKVNFQKETVKDLSLRGTSLAIDLPFLDLVISKGLTDFGLYQIAWPQNFFGLKFGLKAKKFWYLQTNLSFISSLQGRYEDLIVAESTSAIGDLYGLDSIPPEENLVFGLATGTENNFFTLDASFALTLYVDDAGSIIDKDKLASDINDGFGIDLAPYLLYVDKISSVFPVLDYFPFTLGLAVDAVNRDLWGLTYGADLAIDSIGLKTWFRKTDASFRSLGSAVVTDVWDIGGTWEREIAGFNVNLGYDWKMDTIPDILFNEIIPIVKPSLAPSADPTENDISNIVHTAQAGIDTPSSNLLGSLSSDYSFEWATTNAKALAGQITSESVASNAILNSSSNDTIAQHTGDFRWKSGRYKMSDLNLSLGAKTKDSYITKVITDGVFDGSTFWEFSYGVSTSLKFRSYSLSLEFEKEWSTETDSLTAYGYDGKFSIANTFFDTISLSGSLDQAYQGVALQAYRIATNLALEKRFGKLSTSTMVEIGFYDSKISDIDDALTGALTVKGTFSK